MQCSDDDDDNDMVVDRFVFGRVSKQDNTMGIWAVHIPAQAPMAGPSPTFREAFFASS